MKRSDWFMAKINTENSRLSRIKMFTYMHHECMYHVCMNASHTRDVLRFPGQFTTRLQHVHACMYNVPCTHFEEHWRCPSRTSSLDVV